ncbi:hypothetical protein BCR32DRAFT_271256 [Anaeromyces robustus]|uniref:histone acetyltransferase n=1 Tax=Anaeromyces robustus TaxID=1754192 RepID=A0A1Y1WSU1_9FUNG|nr:hypothetical protein BCR32DRAFT_271256 [Anaeromyces robustus]|eukprot:ORX76465.1 hypothetical protein BCR32DRAFT_271256 [Anaeromyces robustus]
MKESLLNAVINLYGHANIDIYVIRSSPKQKNLYSKKQLNKKGKNNSNIYDMRNVLILAATKNNNNNNNNNNKTEITIFNAGIFCNEYINLNEKKVILYISKIDTSGWETLERQPLSLIRALILGYLNYYQNLYKGTDMTVTLHLYTRAKPNYLFPTSDDADTTNKHILTDSELINWWIKTLSHYPKIFIPESGYWYCPTGERIGQLQTIINQNVQKESLKNQLKLDTSICPWTWGYPFNKSALALEVIPQFPDDPKNSLIHSEKRANLIHEKTTVREFFEYLSIENFSGSVSACIILNIYSNNTDIHNNNDKKSTSNLNELNLKEFEALMDVILSQNYALEEDAKISSKTLHDYLKKINEEKKILYINYKLNKNLDLKNEENTNDTSPTLNNLQSSIKRKNVNDLQGLIKKKKTEPSSQSSNGINNLQGLIKRKKNEPSSQSSNGINNLQGLIKRKKETSPQKPTNNINNIQGLIKRK